MSQSRNKLPADQRRTQILESVQGLIAEKGFHGTTTRELAEAANVSEALLFKHFPSKEALYRALVGFQCSNKCGDWETVERLNASTETLVKVVHFLVTRLVTKSGRDPQHLTIDRMLLRSLSEDGEYARVVFGELRNCVISKLDDCLKVAAKSGDLITKKPLPLGAWFTHQLALMQMFLRLPSESAVPYSAQDADVIIQATQFCLRGLGVREDVIIKHLTRKSTSAAKQE